MEISIMKRKLFWIVYLVVATLCATLFLIIFQEYRTFGLSSLFLIVMLPLFIYLMWATSPLTTVKETEWHRFQTKILHLRYDKQLKFHEDVTEKRDDISQELNKSFFVVHLGLLFVCPAVFVCIFLFSHIIKIIVLGVPFVLLILCISPLLDFPAFLPLQNTCLFHPLGHQQSPRNLPHFPDTLHLMHSKKIHIPK